MLSRPLKSLQLIVICSMALIGFSCKKAIEQQKKNIIIDAMTNGSWLVEKYTENTIDITSSFSGYDFKFYENGNVEGSKGALIKSGTWNADVNNYTITASFINPGDTLVLLNKIWTITNPNLDYVEAKTTTTNGDNILHLRKKP